jgi:hypothetical protein
MESLIIIMPTPENFTNPEWSENWDYYEMLFRFMQKLEFWENKE